MGQLTRALDTIRELRICYHKARMLAAERARRAHHDEFMRLVRGRSPEWVRRMERDRRLS